ncbi:MAG: hypothetical protein ACRC92_20610 [Peptostreptococcaceae bacterium]
MLIGFETNLAGQRLNTPKWNIGNVIQGKISGSMGSKSIYTAAKDLNDKDAYELDRVLRTVDLEFSKITLEFDRLSRDLTSMSSQLKKRISAFSEMGEPGEVEIQYRKMEMDLVIAKSRLIEQKSKIFESKLKQSRDERKLFLDKLKAANSGGGTSVVEQQALASGNPTSPVTVLSMAQQTNGNATAFGIPLSAYKPSQQVVIKADKGEGVTTQQPQADATFQVSSQQQSTPTPVVTQQPVLQRTEDVPLSTANFGVVKSDTPTLNSVQTENARLIEQRLANKEKIFDNTEGIMKSTLKRSLNSVVNSSLDVKEVLYVDKNTGRFWVEGFVDSPQGLTKLESYEPKSILHIGKIRFDAKNKVCKTVHYEGNIPYEISDESQMPDFYVKQWTKDHADSVILPEEVLERI